MLVGVVMKDGMIFNKLNNDLENKWGDTEHALMSTMIGRILCIFNTTATSKEIKTYPICGVPLHKPPPTMLNARKKDILLCNSWTRKDALFNPNKARSAKKGILSDDHIPHCVTRSS